MRVLITGANRGLGFSLTQEALKNGHEVFACVRDPKRAGELEKLKTSGKNITILPLDVSDPESVSALKTHLDGVSNIDVLINNAGVIGNKNPFSELTIDDLIGTFRTNTFGPFLITQLLIPWLLKSKTPIATHITSKMGSIEDNSSGGYYPYRMSKAALNMFNKSFAIDYPQIISVVMHPGWVQTDMGGSGATVSAAESSQGIWKVLSGLKKSNSGQFFDFRGQEISW